jgi:prevent-host-death family protein
MNEIGAYDAKTHLPRLLERVEKGERFVITRHGKPVAELVPVAERDSARVQRAIADLHGMRSQFAKRGLRLRDAIGNGSRLRERLHEGHRF